MNSIILKKILTGFAVIIFSQAGLAQGTKFKFEFNQQDSAPSYLLLHFLGDDVVHGEYGVGVGPALQTEIYSSPMVLKKDQHFVGPSELNLDEKSQTLVTKRFRLQVESATGCLVVFDRIKGSDLTTICPWALHHQVGKGLSINSRQIENVYGVAQYFNKARVGDSEGDWFTHGIFDTGNGAGNNFTGFPGDSSGAWGANSEVQFPMMYALGRQTSFGFFFDNVYKQRWEFNDGVRDPFNPWINIRVVNSDEFPMSDHALRFYLIGGDDPLTVRQNYMELVGRPPVPPKKALGLWVSEFGFDSWAEIDHTLHGEKNGRPGLRAAGFPVDGFVLDLQWYGGVSRNDPNTRMGSLEFDPVNFANAKEKVKAYQQDGIEFVAIEQSYVGENQRSYTQLLKRGDRNDDSRAGYLIHHCNSDRPIAFSDWFGRVGMVDWSETAAGVWFHERLRKPNLIELGVTGHWTDLGEPERFVADSCYENSESQQQGLNLFRHGDIHNLYNFLWHKSIFSGYQRDQIRKRPLLLARAGAPGIQRFGAAMWSGDITGRLEALANHWNAQMHMAFNGIDYYGSDIGGFWRHSVVGDRAVEPGHGPTAEGLYTQWYAASAWTDIPLRPHGYNCGFDPTFLQAPGCVQTGDESAETSPAWMGSDVHIESQRFATHQRYELIPYYYSLAHQAHNLGLPVVAPPVMHFPQDPLVREMGHQKMIGKDIMVALVARHGQSVRKVYLPAGDWYNYHTGEFVSSVGEWTDEIDLWSTGKFVLPVFVRAGAILPAMTVDRQTKNVFGQRLDGRLNTDLILKIYSDRQASSFVVWEDDGVLVDHYNPQPQYSRRAIKVSQQLVADKMEIEIAAAEGTYVGEQQGRNNFLQVFLPRNKINEVFVNGVSLQRLTSPELLSTSDKGYILLGQQLQLKTGVISTAEAVKIVVQ